MTSGAKSTGISVLPCGVGVLRRALDSLGTVVVSLTTRIWVLSSRDGVESIETGTICRGWS